MPKMKYVGPGTDESRKHTMVVQDHEVAALEATGLWKPVQVKKEKKDG